MPDEWKQEWQPVIDRIGSSTDGDAIRWGADPIEAGAVRRYLEPLEFDCDLHSSRAVATGLGYADIVAPYTSVSTWTLPAIWGPGRVLFDSAERDAQPTSGFRAATVGQYPPRATGYFATDVAITFHRALVVGDQLGRRPGRLIDVSVKETSVGRGAFLKNESEVVDGNEHTIATISSGLYVYEPMGTRAPTPPQPRATDEPADAVAVDLDRQRLGSDVIVGERLRPVQFPLPVYRLVMEAGVNRDFNSIHHNTEFAQASGAPEMYANTLFLQGMWERTIREYIGTAGTIKRLAGFRMKSFNCAGDVVTVRGRVVDVRPTADDVEVDVSMWSENSNGVSVGPGTVTVGLPVA